MIILPHIFMHNYAEFEELIEIKSLASLRGNLPRKQHKKVIAWASDNQEILQDDMGFSQIKTNKMRKTSKIPRIIKINKIDGFNVYCAFNTGEYRIIEFEKLFTEWDTSTHPFQSKLLNPKEFSQVIVHEGTLQWPNLKQTTKLSNGMEFEVMFDLDPIVLYEASIPDEEGNKRYQIGAILKTARKEAGLTQEELAKRSGTTKNYISRIENNRSDLEVGTLIKIIEIGLGRKFNLLIS